MLLVAKRTPETTARARPPSRRSRTWPRSASGAKASCATTLARNAAAEMTPRLQVGRSWASWSWASRGNTTEVDAVSVAVAIRMTANPPPGGRVPTAAPGRCRRGPWPATVAALPPGMRQRSAVDVQVKGSASTASEKRGQASNAQGPKSRSVSDHARPAGVGVDPQERATAAEVAERGGGVGCRPSSAEPWRHAARSPGPSRAGRSAHPGQHAAQRRGTAQWSRPPASPGSTSVGCWSSAAKRRGRRPVPWAVAAGDPSSVVAPSRAVRARLGAGTRARSCPSARRGRPERLEPGVE